MSMSKQRGARDVPLLQKIFIVRGRFMKAPLDVELKCPAYEGESIESEGAFRVLAVPHPVQPSIKHSTV